MNSSRPISQRPVRAAIIGAGLMGRGHAHALTRAGGTVVAVADPNSARAKRLAQSCRARAFDSLQALLKQEKVDAIHVCTPLTTHVDLALQALNADAHALVEKPLAPDAALTAQLLEHAQMCTRLIMPVHQFIFQSGVRAALTRLPHLAPLAHLEMTAMTAGGEGMDDAACDQLVADIVPHALALFQRCLPNGLDGVEWIVRRPGVGELRAWGQSGDTSLAIIISTRGRPTRNDLTIIGARGSAHIDLFHGFAVFESGPVSRAQKILRPFNLSAQTFAMASLNLSARALRGDVAYPGLRELIGAFYDAIRSGASVPISPQEILSVARARDQLMAQLRHRIEFDG